MEASGGEGMNRGQWGNKLEFFLTLLGSAVGLGNVWRFPYLLFKSGGGAFLLPFIVMLFLIGIPLFYLEINLGQFSSFGPLSMWECSPIMKGIGYSSIFTVIIIAIYYNVIISWCLYFLFASFTNVLPWQDCNNLWNTANCTTQDEFRKLIDNNQTWKNTSDGLIVPRSELKTPSEEYFYRKVLQMSEGLEYPGTVVWQLACCLMLTWFIVFLVLIKGIKSLGKVVYFTSTFPYILLTVMLVRGALLPGAAKGIEFYIVPDFGKLADLKVWSDAAVQVFYSLCCVTGCLVAMSSYNKFHNNTSRDALTVPIVNMFTSIYAGFVIFSILGYMAEMKGVEVADVAADGPGLVFVVYPEGLSTMPAAPVWSVLFFSMMLMLGLSSLFGMTETFFVSFIDEYPQWLRTNFIRGAMFRGLLILFFFLISLPMLTNGGFYLFNLLDVYISGFPLLVVGVVFLFSINVVYGYFKFSEDIEMMLGKKPNVLMQISICYLSPLIITGVIVASSLSYKSPTLFNGKYSFSLVGEIIGWLLVAFCIMFIPLYFIYTVCKNGLIEIIKMSAKSTEDWGPALQENRIGKYENKSKLDNVSENDSVNYFDSAKRNSQNRKSAEKLIAEIQMGKLNSEHF